MIYGLWPVLALNDRSETERDLDRQLRDKGSVQCSPIDSLKRTLSSSSTACSQHSLRISGGRIPEYLLIASCKQVRTASLRGAFPPTPHVTLHVSSSSSGTRAIAITSAVLLRGFGRVKVKGAVEYTDASALQRLCFAALVPLLKPALLLLLLMMWLLSLMARAPSSSISAGKHAIHTAMGYW
jgi:hypothetical protein